MKYKGFKELQSEGHWIKKSGTDMFFCSECGHIQDIYKKGTVCEECGTFMIFRLVREERKNERHD